MRRLLVALCLVATTVPVAAMASAPPAAAADPFIARGSVEQVYSYGHAPGATVSLLDASNAVIDSGPADSAGAKLFRDVAPGTGYQVQTPSGTVGPLTVTSSDVNPPGSFYDAEAAAHPLSAGYGYITTRDGTKLSINVTFPKDGSTGPWPVILNYSGYDPSQPGDPPREVAMYPYQGYVTVGVNLRGTTCSGGAFEFMEDLQALDGYDVVELLARQTWSNGNVGMAGISYSGYSQLYVGATNPPHLDAITPSSPYSDTYSGILYPGGILNDGFALGWATEREQDARATALNNTLIRTGSNLTSAFDEGAGVVTQSIREASNQMIEQIASETGLKVGGTLYSDALSEEGGPAATYIDLMRHNVSTIKGAVTGS